MMESLDDWRHRALCYGEDPELFFPVKNSEEAAKEAKRICRQCPVADECLQEAIDAGEQFGIWGGQTEDERCRLRRKGQATRPKHLNTTQRIATGR